jgi:GcrA cell cycle regulator
MNQGPDAWPPDRVKWLANAWTEEKLSATKIGKELGISRNAVLGKLNRLHLLGQRRVIAAPTPKSPKAPPPPKAPTIRKLVVIKEPTLDPADMVTLFDAKRNQCRWPVGDPASPDFRFCGRLTEWKHPYCPAHEAFLKGTLKTRARRKAKTAGVPRQWNIR